MAESLFVGNLVAEPEVRETREGKPWASFTLVHSDRVQENGEWVDGPATFLDCVMFAHGAANLAGLLKGTRLMVAGRLKQQNWESKAGEKRSKIQLVVDEAGVSTKFGAVSFLKSPAGQQAQSAPQPSQDGWANPGQSFDSGAPF